MPSKGNSCHASAQVDLQIHATPLEMLCFDLYGCSYKYRIFAVCRPLDSSSVYKTIDHVSYVQQVTDKIEHLANNKGPAIVVGDLNCPDVDWNPMSVPLNELQRAVYLTHKLCAVCQRANSRQP